VSYWLFRRHAAGFGNVQIQLTFLGSLLLMTVLNETMGMAFIIPAATCDLNLRTSDKGLLTGMPFLGEHDKAQNVKSAISGR